MIKELFARKICFLNKILRKNKQSRTRERVSGKVETGVLIFAAIMYNNQKAFSERGIQMQGDMIKMPSGARKALSVFLGALLGGLMWRFRGTHGYGGSWGLVAVGTAFALLIFVFYGKSIKTDSFFSPCLRFPWGLRSRAGARRTVCFRDIFIRQRNFPARESVFFSSASRGR